MSAEMVRQLMTRAMAEPEFRSRLLRHPAEAGAGYDLSAAEMGALRHLTPENFDTVAALLTERAAPPAPATPAAP